MTQEHDPQTVAWARRTRSGSSAGRFPRFVLQRDNVTPAGVSLPAAPIDPPLFGYGVGGAGIMEAARPVWMILAEPTKSSPGRTSAPSTPSR